MAALERFLMHRATRFHAEAVSDRFRNFVPRLRASFRHPQAFHIVPGDQLVAAMLQFPSDNVESYRTRRRHRWP